MEDVRVIAHAKAYFDRLAQWVDPIGGQSIPEDGTLDREGLKELFANAAQLMQEELDRAEGRELQPPVRSELPRRVIAGLCPLELGLNPSGPGFLPPDSVLRQERLEKCFLFAQQLLRRRLELEVEPEEQAEPSPEEPTVASVMKELCISLGFTGYQNFLGLATLEWLVREGFVVATPIENRKKLDYQATPKGIKSGLRCVSRVDKQGEPFSQILCGEQARQLLRDNVQQIIAMRQAQWELLLACLTPEWHSRAVCAEGEVGIVQLVKQINSQLPEDLPKKIAPNELSYWLVWKGFLETAVSGQYPYRIPTQVGESLGIKSILDRNSGKNLWSIPAQQFILDNLNGIVQDLASGEAYKWGPRELVITDQVRNGLKAQPRLLSLAYLEAAINGVLKDGRECPNLMPKRLISSWLLQEQYLANRKGPDGVWALNPTEKGEAAGLVNEEGALRFSEAGQRFVYDHLEQIFDYYREMKTR